MPFRKTLTESELRGRRMPLETKEFIIEKDVYITQGAKEYLQSRNIELIVKDKEEIEQKPKYGTMTINPVERSGKNKYANFETGEEYAEKPEDMTHLRGHLLISKLHPIIELRGKIDSLLSAIMEVQILAEREQKIKVVTQLEEVRQLIMNVLSAEVKGTPLKEVKLLDMDCDRLRYVSHNVKQEIGIDHPIPHYKMGELLIKINSLRTKIRETELSAVKAVPERMDIIQAFNRMSSCVYIIFCKTLAQNTGKREVEQ